MAYQRLTHFLETLSLKLLLIKTLVHTILYTMIEDPLTEYSDPLKNNWSRYLPRIILLLEVTIIELDAI